MVAKIKTLLNKESRQAKFPPYDTVQSIFTISNNKINLRGEKTSSLELFTLCDKAENGPG